MTGKGEPWHTKEELGSKDASDSTLKQLTTCGVSNTNTVLYCTVL